MAISNGFTSKHYLKALKGMFLIAVQVVIAKMVRNGFGIYSYKNHFNFGSILLGPYLLELSKIKLCSLILRSDLLAPFECAI